MLICLIQFQRASECFNMFHTVRQSSARNLRDNLEGKINYSANDLSSTT